MGVAPHQRNPAGTTPSRTLTAVGGLLFALETYKAALCSVVPLPVSAVHLFSFAFPFLVMTGHVLPFLMFFFTVRASGRLHCGSQPLLSVGSEVLLEMLLPRGFFPCHFKVSFEFILCLCRVAKRTKRPCRSGPQPVRWPRCCISVVNTIPVWGPPPWCSGKMYRTAC